MICFSLIQLGMMFMSIARASASAKRINDVLDCKLEIEDGNININDINEKGVVEFKNVSFKYPQASENVLENLVPPRTNSAKFITKVQKIFLLLNRHSFSAYTRKYRSCC